MFAVNRTRQGIVCCYSGEGKKGPRRTQNYKLPHTHTHFRTGGSSPIHIYLNNGKVLIPHCCFTSRNSTRQRLRWTRTGLWLNQLAGRLHPANPVIQCLLQKLQHFFTHCVIYCTVFVLLFHDCKLNNQKNRIYLRYRWQRITQRSTLRKYSH